MNLYPTLDSVKAFIDILKRGDIKDYMQDVDILTKDEWKPVRIYYEYLGKLISSISDTKREILMCHLGFLMCLHLFKRHLESIEEDLDQQNMELDSLQNYVAYLEEEINGLKG